MPTPLAEGQENSFSPQMIFLWPGGWANEIKESELNSDSLITVGNTKDMSKYSVHNSVKIGCEEMQILRYNLTCGMVHAGGAIIRG